MSTALDVRPQQQPVQQAAALAIRPGQVMWDEYQLAALSQIGLKDASNADRAVFLHQCQRTGLDPFSRQIYMIGRNEKQPDGSWGKKWTIQTGIDGWRVVRDRAERHAGVRGTLGRAVWYDHEGNEFKVWVRRDPPAACEITYTVRDANGETPYTSVLQFAEYVQAKDGKPIAQWATKGSHMLEKCTEADVYRKAFPQDFAGLSLDDAMPAADTTPPPTAARVTAADIRGRTRPQVRAEIVRDHPDASPAGRQVAPVPAAPSDPPSEPAGEAPDETDRDSPGTVTPKQLTQLGATFTDLGFTSKEREQRLVAASQIIGRDVESSSDLSLNEASKLIDTLDGLDGSREKLIALLAAGEVTGDE